MHAADPGSLDRLTMVEAALQLERAGDTATAQQVRAKLREATAAAAATGAAVHTTPADVPALNPVKYPDGETWVRVRVRTRVTFKWFVFAWNRWKCEVMMCMTVSRFGHEYAAGDQTGTGGRTVNNVTCDALSECQQLCATTLQLTW